MPVFGFKKTTHRDIYLLQSGQTSFLIAFVERKLYL